MLLVLVAAWRFHPWPGVTRAVGEQDDLVFRNFHDAARVDGVAYRYSKGGDRGPARASHVTLPQVGRCRASLLRLELHTPGDQPPVALAVLGGGETLHSGSVQGRATLDVPLPGAALEGGDLDVALVAAPWTRGQNPRLLGVAVERVTWTPQSWTWPPTRQLLLLPLLAAAVAAQALALGSRIRTALLASAGIGGAAAVAAAWRPLEVAPYSARLLLFALAVCATQLTCALLLRESGQSPWSLPPGIYPAALIPILASGYWALWLFHVVLCRESGRAFCPPGGVTAVGTATSVAIVALLLVPDRARRLRWAGGVILLAAAAVGLLTLGALLRRPALDFMTLWQAGQRLAAGQSAYDLAHVAENHFGAVFKVPPFYGMLLLPFARLSFARALLVHRALDVTLYLLCGALLVRLLRPHVGRGVAVAAVVLVAGLMHPAFDTIAYGQIDIVLLAAMIGALLAHRAGRPLLAGLAIAFGTLLKLYPLLLAGDAVARRDWKLLGAIAGGLAALVALAVAVVGWSEHVIYATAVLPAIGGGTGWIENQTLNGFACRLLGYTAPRPVPLRSVALFTNAAFVVVAGATLLAAARRSDVRSPVRALQFAAFLVAMLLAVPAAWMHYSTLTVLPFVLLVWDAARRPFSRGEAFAAALAFGLVAYGNQWSFFDGRPAPGLGILALSLKLYGLLALWSLLLRRIWTAEPAR